MLGKRQQISIWFAVERFVTSWATEISYIIICRILLHPGFALLMGLESRPCKKDPKISVYNPLLLGPTNYTRKMLWFELWSNRWHHSLFWGIWRPNFRDYREGGGGGREGEGGGRLLSWPILTVIRQTGRKRVAGQPTTSCSRSLGTISKLKGMEEKYSLGRICTSHCKGRLVIYKIRLWCAQSHSYYNNIIRL